MTDTIRALHTERHLEANARRIRRMLGILSGIALVATILIIASFIWRDATHMNNPNEKMSQLVTIAVTAVSGSAILFLWGMKLSPLLAYRKYLRESYQGLSREVEGVIRSVSDDLSFREGLYFRACVLNVGDPASPEDDRLLYWDERLSGFPFAVGDAVRVRAHGNDIIGISPRG